MKEIVIEATKQVARVAVFGAVSSVLGLVLEKWLGVPADKVAVVTTGAMVWVDRFIHVNPKIKLNGLTDSKIIKLVVKNIFK